MTKAIVSSGPGGTVQVTHLEEQKTAVEVQAMAAKEPTLDEYMRRDPATLQLQDLPPQVELLRTQRVDFNIKEAKRAAKKEGVEE